MAVTFDQATLAVLHNAVEVDIHTSASAARGIVIWVVVVDGRVFARSFRGSGAKWYVAAVADGRAALGVGDRRWPVGVAPVTSPAVIDAVSQAYLRKYATSPYAAEMVRGRSCRPPCGSTRFDRLYAVLIPVLPNPPASRLVTSRFSTSCHAARLTGASTAWAIRAPRSITKGSEPVLRMMIPISPR
jgi:hypothetical protein